MWYLPGKCKGEIQQQSKSRWQGTRLIWGAHIMRLTMQDFITQDVANTLWAMVVASRVLLETFDSS